MSFLDTLRAARESRVAILHEFWTQYDPQAKRVHAFCEAHDDIVFFLPHIERALPKGFRVLPYRCEGKAQVMEVFEQITRKIPESRLTLFFVDKDIDDILGTPWPTDPRIFITEFYSIDNYLVTSAIMARLYRDMVKISGVAIDEGAIRGHFESQLTRFHRQMLGIMSWIVVVRRDGDRPNLAGLQMSSLWRFSSAGGALPLCGHRIDVLAKQTGVRLPPGGLKRVRQTMRELGRVPAKRILRGKFEAWFFVEFWKNLLAHLDTVAKEAGGKVSVRVQLTERAFVAVLAPYLDTPKSLEMFLRTHLGALGAGKSDHPPAPPLRRGIMERLFDWLARLK